MNRLLLLTFLTASSSHVGGVHAFSWFSASFAPTSEAAAPPNPPLVVGDYTLLFKLGEGSFGKVWQASQHPLGKQVAVKIFHPGSTAHAEYEQSIHEKLEHNAQSRIVRLLDKGKLANGQAYSVLELLEGGDLQKRLKTLSSEDEFSKKTFDENLARRIFRDIVSGVQELHETGLAHRDLKLANIFLDGDDNAKVGDLNLATQVKAWTRTNSKTIWESWTSLEYWTTWLSRGPVAGTAEYYSPEVVAFLNGGYGSGRYSPVSSDIWALGVVLYKMVVGKFPCNVEQHFPSRSPNRMGGGAGGGVRWAIRCSDGYNLGLKGVSENLEHMLQGLLTFDVKQRLTMADIKSHPWFLAGPLDGEPAPVLSGRLDGESGGTSGPLDGERAAGESPFSMAGGREVDVCEGV